MNPAITPGLGGQKVLADTIPGARVRDVALVVAGAALTALFAQISIHVPGTPVPITGQTLAVVLAGSALGTWRGAASQLLYVLAGFLLPIYAGGTSGASVIWSANGGYLIGFIVAAGLIGWASEHGADRNPIFAAIMFALGQLVIFGIGVPWLKVSLGVDWSTAISLGFTPFILGGIVKAAIAAIVMPSAWAFQKNVTKKR